MNLREFTALTLLFRACPDQSVRQKVLKLVPKMAELIDIVDPDPVLSDENVMELKGYTTNNTP